MRKNVNRWLLRSTGEIGQKTQVHHKQCCRRESSSLEKIRTSQESCLGFWKTKFKKLSSGLPKRQQMCSTGRGMGIYEIISYNAAGQGGIWGELKDLGIPLDNQTIACNITNYIGEGGMVFSTEIGDKPGTIKNIFIEKAGCFSMDQPYIVKPSNSLALYGVCYKRFQTHDFAAINPTLATCNHDANHRVISGNHDLLYGMAGKDKPFQMFEESSSSRMLRSTAKSGQKRNAIDSPTDPMNQTAANTHWAIAA